MDPETLVFAEVVGMVGVAAFMTLSLRGGEESNPRQLPSDPPPVTMTVLCPGWKCNADVIVGVKGDAVDGYLGVTACDLLLEGESCNEACVMTVLRA